MKRKQNKKIKLKTKQTATKETVNKNTKREEKGSGKVQKSSVKFHGKTTTTQCSKLTAVNDYPSLVCVCVLKRTVTRCTLTSLCCCCCCSCVDAIVVVVVVGSVGVLAHTKCQPTLLVCQHNAQLFTLHYVTLFL